MVAEVLGFLGIMPEVAGGAKCGGRLKLVGISMEGLWEWVLVCVGIKIWMVKHERLGALGLGGIGRDQSVG